MAKQNKAINALKQLALKALKQKHPKVPEHALPNPKYSDRSSNGLTKCIVDWINLNGFQAERINSMGRRIDNRETNIDAMGFSRTIGSLQWIKSAGQVGTADISATIKGRAVKIEVKCAATGDKYQSQKQKEYQQHIENAGGTYIIARTFEQFYQWYKEFIK